jgi:hypothetical protein
MKLVYYNTVLVMLLPLPALQLRYSVPLDISASYRIAGPA